MREWRRRFRNACRALRGIERDFDIVIRDTRLNKPIVQAPASELWDLQRFWNHEHELAGGLVLVVRPLVRGRKL